MEICYTWQCRRQCQSARLARTRARYGMPRQRGRSAVVKPKCRVASSSARARGARQARVHAALAYTAVRAHWQRRPPCSKSGKRVRAEMPCTGGRCSVGPRAYTASAAPAAGSCRYAMSANKSKTGRQGGTQALARQRASAAVRQVLVVQGAAAQRAAGRTQKARKRLRLHVCTALQCAEPPTSPAVKAASGSTA